MITGWTSWRYADEESPYLDFSDSICKLKKPCPKIYTKRELEGKSEKKIKKLFDKSHKKWEKYNKHPFLKGKEKEGKALIAYREKCYEDLFNFCVENRIYISPDEHQNTIDWGVPIFDDKYIDHFSLRSWADLMAEVWNKIMDRTDLTYLDFYCNDADKVIKDYKKPVEDLLRDSMGPY